MKLILVTLLSMLWLAGCSKEPADASLVHYRDYIKSLHKNDLYSVSKSLSYYKKNISTATQDIRDSAFADFRNLYFQVINVYTQEFYNNNELISKLHKNEQGSDVAKFKNDLEENGMRLSITEGNFFIDEKPEFLYNNFHQTVSASLRDFLTIRRNELEEGFSEDARLTIPFRKVGERIRTWEEYIKRYPNSLLIADAKVSYQIYLNTFITGLDNSPVSEEQKLKPEIKAEYEYYISLNKETESGKIVYNFYNLLSQHGFVFTTDVDQFYEDNSIQPMQGIAPGD